MSFNDQVNTCLEHVITPDVLRYTLSEHLCKFYDHFQIENGRTSLYYRYKHDNYEDEGHPERTTYENSLRKLNMSSSYYLGRVVKIRPLHHSSFYSLHDDQSQQVLRVLLRQCYPYCEQKNSYLYFFYLYYKNPFYTSLSEANEASFMMYPTPHNEWIAYIPAHNAKEFNNLKEMSFKVVIYAIRSDDWKGKLYTNPNHLIAIDTFFLDPR